MKSSLRLLSLAFGGVVVNTLINKQQLNYSKCSSLPLDTENKVFKKERFDAATEKSRIDFVNFTQAYGVPGASICVKVKDDEGNWKTVWEEGFGYSDIENGVKVTPHTKMRIASISKAFTSAALGVLYESGKLKLDDPVQNYVPSFSQNTENLMTVSHLAAHLSGIRHYNNEKKEFYSSKNFSNTLEALSIFQLDPLLHPPGTHFHYSTYGYTVLAAVLEKASGLDYPTLMKEKVFVPLRMIDTLVDVNNSVISHRSRQYTRKKKPLENSAYVDVSYKIAGGGFLSTPNDITKFAIGLLDGKILKKETVEILWSPQKTLDGNSTHYGLGWAIKKVPENGSRIIYHTGGATGGCSMLVIFPEEKVVLAFTMNLEEPKVTDFGLKLGMNFAIAVQESRT